MERWYLPIRCHPKGRGDKHVERLVTHISQYIRLHQLYSLIPVIHVEKKPRGEFFLFIGIDSEQKNQIPVTLVPLAKLIGNPLSGTSAVEYHDIARMVSGPVTPYDYARRINYREQQTLPQDDPFDFFEEMPSQYEASSDEQITLSEDYNKLLYWLSAVGSGTWQIFKNVCKALDLDKTGNESRRILRRLRLLGHIEVSRDGTHWTICPPCLISTGIEPQQEYILAGQRSMQLLEEIEQIEDIKLKFTKQSKAQAPTSIHIQINAASNPDKLMREVGLHFPINYVGNVAQKLAEILPSLEEWRDSLTPVGRFLPALYEVERFSNGTFAHSESYKETGMYRLHPRDRNSQMSRTLFYHQSSDQWLQGDWYGLRFLALREEHTECKAIYDVKTRCLALPVSQRWPDLYERTLVLCSGRLANQRNEWLFFYEVPREIALKLAHQLTVTYEEVSNA